MTDYVDINGLALYDSLIKDYIDGLFGQHENLCPQTATDWEQGGISATGGNLSRTHTIRLKNASRFEITGGVPYLIDVQDGYKLIVKPYNSAGTFYSDSTIGGGYIENYPFVWIPERDGYLRLCCTIDQSTALAPAGIEDALPVVRQASFADLGATLYNVEVKTGYYDGTSGGSSAQSAAGELF